MPSVEYDVGDLTHLLGQRYEIEYLREKIPMMGVDLEKIDEKTMIVEVFPNRPDMLSIEGFARAVKGFLGAENGLKSYLVHDSDITVYIDKTVDDVRPCVSAAVIRNIELDDYTVKSIMNMQEKLHLTHGRNRRKVAIGVHDLDKVAPPFTYKAVEPKKASFIPLDMSEPLNLDEILKKHPKGRDFASCLDGKSRYPLFVDKKGSVLSFPPIINGELTKLTEYTRNLFIELTGTDQHATDTGLNIICTSLADRGGAIHAVAIKKIAGDKGQNHG